MATSLHARRVVAGLVAAFALAIPTQATAAVVDVDPRKLGPRLAKHFLGFSGEFDLMRSFVAQRNTGVANPVFVRLARNLAAFGGGAPTTRIGGGSTDSFWFANGINKRRPGDLYTIDYGWLADIRAYTNAAKSPLILGVNLGRNDPQLAAQWARAVMNFFPRGTIEALEIGNEPDNYFQRIFVPETGQLTRPRSYGPGQYLRELFAYTSALERVRPRPPLAGPSTIAEYPDWKAKLPTIIENQQRRLDLVTGHRYPLFACGKKPGTKRDVDPRELMDATSVDSHFLPVRDFVDLAGRFGKSVRITESNSVACGGDDGSSNAFASAVWGVDWLFMLAATGVVGVDFHTSALHYQPFQPVTTTDGRRAAFVRPIYYAMLLFAEATANRSRLVRGVTQKTVPGLRTWATYDGVDRVVRMAVVNKSGRRQRIRLTVRGARGRATVKRLSGPSLGATSGVRLGGRKFPLATFTGKLPGPPRLERAVRKRGSFSVRMPRYGVALVTVPVAR